MRFPQILLGLVAPASAIDIYLHFSGGCTGNAAVCTEYNPDTCCQGSSGDIFPSVAFMGIPTFWNLDCRGYSGGNCNAVREIQPASNTNLVCLNSGFFSGRGYGFRNQKRADGAVEGCEKPDILLFEDGGKYNITGLEEAHFTKLVCVYLSSDIFKVYILTV